VTVADPAQPQFFRFARGEAVAPTFTPDAVPASGIAGWTIVWYAWYQGDAFATATEITRAASITDPTAGTFTVTLTSADTKALTAGLWGWEAWRTDAGSERHLAYGTFELQKAKHTFA
jgi:hypothetical protein